MTQPKFTQLNTHINEALSQHKWIDVDQFVVQGTDEGYHNLVALANHGCVSGAYMPAVTYHMASEVMAQHGDDVMEYIYDTLGEIPSKLDITQTASWSSMCVYFLSMAIELLAQEELDQIENSSFYYCELNSCKG